VKIKINFGPFDLFTFITSTTRLLSTQNNSAPAKFQKRFEKENERKGYMLKEKG
jgi:hypothetical protein